MEYLIHVIDESSQHKKTLEESKDFHIVEGRSENGEIGDVVRSDAFYLISDDNPINAIISVANIIKIKDTDDQHVALAKLLSKSNAENENSSIEDDTFLPLKVTDLKMVDNYNSELIKTTCQIKRINGEDTWIELHNISFFVIPREKIMFVK